MTTEPEDEQRRGGLREAVSELFGRGGDRGESDRRDDTGRDDMLRDDMGRDDMGREDAGYAEDSAGPRHGYGGEPGGGRQGEAEVDPSQQTSPGARYGDGEPAAGGGYDESGAGTGSSEYTPPLGEPLAQGTHPSETRSPHGGEVRGDTASPEYLGEGGDPTAGGAVQHGGELRGDPGVAHEMGDTRSTADDAPSGGPARDAGVGDMSGGAGGAGVAGGMAAAAGAAQRHAASGAGRHDAATDAAEPDTTSAGTTQRDAASAGAGTTQRDAAAGSGAVASSADQDGSERPPALVTRDRAESYGARWDTVKGAFVDEPRRAVADADALVGELLDELQELFKQQRREIEHGLDRDETSTEDLRIALRRYRSFFDRLLSI